MKQKYLIVSAFAIVAVLISCGVYASHLSSPISPIVPTQSLPTSTSAPTSTPNITNTPNPTSTTSVSPSLSPTPTGSPNPTPVPTQNVTFVDSTGYVATLSTSTSRIASINMAVTEEICALGGFNRLVGRDDGSVVPPAVMTVPVVASSSNSPNMEALLAQEPEVVFADTMLSSKTDVIQQMKSSGIQVIIVNPGNFSQTLEFINFLGIVLNNQTVANDIVNTLTYYNNLVVSRLANLSDTQRPKVYMELSSAWRSFSGTSIRNEMLVKAGGINIAANMTGSTLTPEYVASSNPDFILRMISSQTKNSSDYTSVRTEIMSRQQISQTNAVKNNAVYVYDSSIGGGIQYPIGLLYWAKWFHPDKFTDIDPSVVNKELFSRYLGIELDGVFAYP